MSKEMKEEYPKPVFISEEVWDNYLKSIEEFGSNFIKMFTDALNEVNEEMEAE